MEVVLLPVDASAYTYVVIASFASVVAFVASPPPVQMIVEADVSQQWKMTAYYKLDGPQLRRR
jgi:hypothetical protein